MATHGEALHSRASRLAEMRKGLRALATNGDEWPRPGDASLCASHGQHDVDSCVATSSASLVLSTETHCVRQRTAEKHGARRTRRSTAYGGEVWRTAEKHGDQRLRMGLSGGAWRCFDRRYQKRLPPNRAEGSGSGAAGNGTSSYADSLTCAGPGERRERRCRQRDFKLRRLPHMRRTRGAAGAALPATDFKLRRLPHMGSGGSGAAGNGTSSCADSLACLAGAGATSASARHQSRACAWFPHSYSPTAPYSPFPLSPSPPLPLFPSSPSPHLPPFPRIRPPVTAPSARYLARCLCLAMGNLWEQLSKARLHLAEAMALWGRATGGARSCCSRIGSNNLPPGMLCSRVRGLCHIGADGAEEAGGGASVLMGRFVPWVREEYLWRTVLPAWEGRGGASSGEGEVDAGKRGEGHGHEYRELMQAAGQRIFREKQAPISAAPALTIGFLSQCFVLLLLPKQLVPSPAKTPEALHGAHSNERLGNNMDGDLHNLHVDKALRHLHLHLTLLQTLPSQSPLSPLAPSHVPVESTQMTPA
ncbi:unnamed protein product [Closterium sp. Naga37s-1]|nr:unnamed protein product [Closterium sp. Naga37s-1]